MVTSPPPSGEERGLISRTVAGNRAKAGATCDPTCDQTFFISFPIPASKYREGVCDHRLVPALISFPDLSWTKPKERSGQIQFALRDHLSGI